MPPNRIQAWLASPCPAARSTSSSPFQRKRLPRLSLAVPVTGRSYDFGASGSLGSGVPGPDPESHSAVRAMTRHPLLALLLVFPAAALVHQPYPLPTHHGRGAGDLTGFKSGRPTSPFNRDWHMG